jgi:antibiotic biosynthesis monooxygenase (ABM) superfamily enzyme
MKMTLVRRVVTTLIVWIAAYAIVGALFLVAGGALERAPIPLRLLIISGVLVITMVNVLMPWLNRLLIRLFPVG